MSTSCNPASRPVVFIGSSTEGIEIARAIQLNLDHDAEVVLWSQGVFGLSGGTLETLVAGASTFDFAVFVVTPDDMILSRKKQKPSPRDNVVFELGLFMGKLGRERTFIVHERMPSLKLPTDLAGITPATFQRHSTGTLQSSLGAASTQVLDSIRALGPLDRREPDVYLSQTTQFAAIANLLDPSARQFIIAMNINNGTLLRPGYYGLGPGYEYWEGKCGGRGHGCFDVSELCRQLAGTDLLSSDLIGNISLTARGKEFAEWLVVSGYKADYFWGVPWKWGQRTAAFSRLATPDKSPRNLFELQASAKKASAKKASAKKASAKKASAKKASAKKASPKKSSTKKTVPRSPR